MYMVHEKICVRAMHTSPTDVASKLTIFSWGTATTDWLLISIMRWPTRTPPRSAIPPRRRLQIWNYKSFIQYVMYSVDTKLQKNSTDLPPHFEHWIPIDISCPVVWF